MNNERTLLTLYSTLSRDLNILKEKFEKLEKSNNETDKILFSKDENKKTNDLPLPAIIVTDIYLVGNFLKVVKYDRENNKNITTSIKLNREYVEESINTLIDSELWDNLSKNSKNIEAKVEELEKIFSDNTSN